MIDLHPLVLLSGSHCLDLATSISERISSVELLNGSPLGSLNLTPHPNGETMVKVEVDVRNKDVFVVASICHKHLPSKNDPYTGVNDNLMELLVIGDTLCRASAYRTTAVIPYFGYARQDRKASGRTPISARLVADMIQAAGFDRALFMDLHAPQIQGFFSMPVDHLNAGSIITEYINKEYANELHEATVLSADAGNVKKSDKYRKGLPDTVGLAFVDKDRKSSTDTRARHIVGDVAGKTVFILDDIISTGGTASQAVKAAMDSGAKSCSIFATHGEFVGPSVERFKDLGVREIVITDTIPLLSETKKELPIKVLPTGHLLGEAIYRIHAGKSISALLGAFG